MSSRRTVLVVAGLAFAASSACGSKQSGQHTDARAETGAAQDAAQDASGDAASDAPPAETWRDGAQDAMLGQDLPNDGTSTDASDAGLTVDANPGDITREATDANVVGDTTDVFGVEAARDTSPDLPQGPTLDFAPGDLGADLRLDRASNDQSTEAGVVDGGSSGPSSSEDQVCSEGGWCWSNPWPLGNALQAVWVFSPTDVWMGGDAGTIVHFDGARWTRTPHAGSDTISAFWGSGPSDLWAAGALGALLHWNGTSWSSFSITSPVVSFAALWGSGPNDVWAAGLNGTLYWWDGQSWSPAPSGTSGTIWSLWGSGTNDVWAALTSGGFLHFDGNGWHNVASPTTGGIYSIWGSAASDVWACTSNKILHYDGTSWTVQKTGLVNAVSGINSLWGTGSSDVWAVLGPISMSDPQLAHWDGQTWTVIPSLGFVPLAGISHMAGSSATDVWLVGGTIIHSDGVQFQEVMTTATLTVNTLSSIAMVGPDDIWANGTSGFIRHQATGGWKAAPSFDPFTGIHLVWAAGPNDLWAFTNSSGPSPIPTKLARWNGTSWSSAKDVAPIFYDPTAAWGASADDVWIAGSAALHLVAGTPTLYQFVDAPNDVWGSGPSDVWMVGGGQSIEHWDGQTWTSTGGSLDFNYYGVWGSSDHDVWLVGDDGAIKHFDGQTWTAVNSGVYSRLNDVWGTGSSDAWIVGDSGVILHWDGKAWSASPSGTVRNLARITGAATGEAWVVGAGGAVLHHSASR